MMLADNFEVPCLIEGGRLVRIQEPGNRGATAVSEVLSIAQEGCGPNCYAVATPLAKPGKTRHNAAKSGVCEDVQRA